PVVGAGAAQVLSEVAAGHFVGRLAGDLHGIALRRRDRAAALPLATQLLEEIPGLRGSLTWRRKGRGEDERRERHGAAGRRQKQAMSHGYPSTWKGQKSAWDPTFAMAGVAAAFARVHHAKKTRHGEDQ